MFIVISLSLSTVIQGFGKCVLTDEELLNLTQKQTFRYFGTMLIRLAVWQGNVPTVLLKR